MKELQQLLTDKISYSAHEEVTILNEVRISELSSFYSVQNKNDTIFRQVSGPAGMSGKAVLIFMAGDRSRPVLLGKPPVKFKTKGSMWQKSSSGETTFLYVADTGNHRIQKFTSDGVFVSKWGSYGIADGQFKHPYDIILFEAADNIKRLYINNRSLKRVDVYTTDGNFISSNVLFTDVDDWTFEMSEMAVGADNNGVETLAGILNIFYQGNFNSQLVMIYKLSDYSVKYYLNNISYNNQYVSGIEIANEKLFVGVQDDGMQQQNKIKTFDLATGNLLSTYTSPFYSGFYSKIKFYNNKIYAIMDSIAGDADNNKIEIMTVNTNGVITHDSDFGSTGMAAGQFYGAAQYSGAPRGLAVSEQGIRVSEINDSTFNHAPPEPTDRDRIQLFDLTGVYINKIGITGISDFTAIPEIIAADETFNQPWSMAIG